MRRLAQLLAAGEVTSTELAALPEQIKERTELNAFITVDEEGALAQAAESDARRVRGEALSPWDGIPLPSRTTSQPKGCALPAPPVFSRTTGLSSTPPWWSG